MLAWFLPEAWVVLLTGAVGPVGARGPDGYRGAPGVPGPAGQQGAKGYRGDVGECTRSPRCTRRLHDALTCTNIMMLVHFIAQVHPAQYKNTM